MPRRRDGVVEPNSIGIGAVVEPEPGLPSGATTPVAELGRRLLATIDGIEAPCAMVATATDVWVTGNGPSMLARIDPGTNAIVSQSPMDGSPCGIALGPDGRLWVALLTAGLVVAVDPATAAVDATLDGLAPRYGISKRVSTRSGWSTDHAVRSFEMIR